MVTNSYNTSGSRLPEIVARELIAKSVSKASHVSFVYKELLRAVINRFSNYVVLDDQLNPTNIKCIHATQERAIAKLTQEDNLILPIISVDQPKTSRADKRTKYQPLIVSESVWDEKKQRAIRVVSLVPTPVDIEYEISIWTKYKNDLDQITEQIQSDFSPDLEILTPFATNIKLFIREEAVDSEVVVSDREDRVLKRIFKIFASTYIPSPKFMMTSTGAIEEFNYQYEINDETTISTNNQLRVSRNSAGVPSTGGGSGGGGGYFNGNASSIINIPVDISPVENAALVYYGDHWAASDVFITESDVSEMRAKVDSVDWGARNYKPDFVKLMYNSELAAGETGAEIAGQQGSMLWDATSSFGEIGRWLVPENTFRGQGVLDIDVMAFFEASAVPTVSNTKLVVTENLVSSIFFSGINGLVIPSSFTLVSTSYAGTATSDWLNTYNASSSRVRRVINALGVYSSNGANYSNLGIASANPYIRAGLVTTDTFATPNRNTVVVYSKNRDISALNENSYFTVSTKLTQETTIDNKLFSNGGEYSYVSGSLPEASSVFEFTSSLQLIYKYDAVNPSAAVFQTSAEPFQNIAEGEFLCFYKVDNSFNGLTGNTPASASIFVSMPAYAGTVNASDLVNTLNPEFALGSFPLSAYVDSGKLVVKYLDDGTGTDDNFEFGVLGDALPKLGIQPSANTYYAHSYFTKQDYYNMGPTSRSYQPSLASALGIFELQVADDPLNDVLDYTDLPYGVDVSTLSYTVYDQSGYPVDGSVNTSTLYQITYMPPPSAVGVVASATFGYPRPWTTVATFEGVSSFTNIYSENRGDFNLHIKMRAGHSNGSTRYQPYTVEIIQSSGVNAAEKKLINRSTIDFTKDRMMRLRFKCVPYSSTGNIIYYSNINSPYYEKTINSVRYYYPVVSRIFAISSIGVTLACLGDGHPF